MEGLNAGKGVKVLVPGPEHKFSLEVEALEQLLLRDDVKDLPVVVISVAGAYRKGKSFLLSFLLRYLHKKYNLNEADDNWLGNPDEPLIGFEWRGGSERHTTGILLWSQPFIATLKDGEKVVIYLMDTQGTFDSHSTLMENVTVFALSTLLSSVQIFNVLQDIAEHELQHLHLFTDYGRQAYENKTGKPFQQLLLLVRDWKMPYEHPFGEQGGQQLLVKRLGTQEGQHQELQSLRKDIDSCFEDLKCFLMPHPGRIVSDEPYFNGKLSDIDERFLQSLKELVPMLLDLDNLIVKKIAGQTVKAKDLFLYAKEYLDMFNKPTMPKPETVFNANARVSNEAAAEEAEDEYRMLMKKVLLGPYLPPEELEEKHSLVVHQALQTFRNKKKIGGDQLSQKYCETLREELEQQFQLYSQVNADKSLLRRLGTLLLLAALVLAAWLTGAAAGTLRLTTVEQLADAVALAAAFALLLLGYFKATGYCKETIKIMDNMATMVVGKLTGMAARQAVSAALSYGPDKKES